jgi:hypothetical protein
MKKKVYNKIYLIAVATLLLTAVDCTRVETSITPVNNLDHNKQKVIFHSELLKPKIIAKLWTHKGYKFLESYLKEPLNSINKIIRLLEIIRSL